MSVEVRELSLGSKMQPFLDVVDTVYADDPMYVRPLDFDLKGRLSPKHPYFKHAQGTNFVAFRNGRPVGRITAHIDQRHLQRYNDATGFFAFFDTINDAEVAQRLLDEAASWLARRGMRNIRGPISLNMAEEVGCLVEGFDTPPMILMPHHRHYQGQLIEAAGFGRIRDFFAWRYVVGNIPPRAARGHEEIARLPEVRVRMIDSKNFQRDVAQLLDIYKDAWEDSWGFTGLTEEEAARTGSELRLIMIPELTRIIDIDGEAAAMAYAVPNINEMIADLGGKIGVTEMAKLLYRLKVRGPKTARLIGLGIRKKYRHVRKYAGLSAYLYVEMNRAGQRLGIQWGELSYTDEANGPVNVGIKMMGGQIYKRYRLFERAVTPT
jgi:hypothetical protein